MEKQNKSAKKQIIVFVCLHILLVVYSLGSVASKTAAAEAFLSFRFCLFYGLNILALGIYAIVWQQLLKHISLTTAFCNKAVTIAWGMLWGVLIFSETITWNMIVGAVIVIAGVVMVVKADA